MAQMYKVFVFGKPLFFAEDRSLIPSNIHVREVSWGANDNLGKLLKQHEHTNNGATAVFSKDPEVSWQQFKSHYKRVKAAGGIVGNEHGQWLFIFRKGVWDLPKGKLDKGEKWKEAALREVGEECGLKGHRIVRSLLKTHHTYNVYGPQNLKTTKWYEMRVEGSLELVPEEQEGITKVEWRSLDDLDDVRANTYGAVLDVLDYLLPQ